jgi:hypothetical protein
VSVSTTFYGIKRKAKKNKKPYHRNNRGKIDTTNTHIHDWSLSWLSTGTSIKSGGVKILL